MRSRIERLDPSDPVAERIGRGLGDSHRERFLAADKNLALLQRHDLLLTALDERDALQGGMLATVRCGWLYVDTLWVAEAARGRGVGTALLARAEDEARALGAVGAWLMSASFEAQDYYPRHGYERFAEIPDYADGGSLAMFRKRLDAAAGD